MNVRKIAKTWHCIVNEMRWHKLDTEPSSDVLLVRNCLFILTLGDRKVSILNTENKNALGKIELLIQSPTFLKAPCSRDSCEGGSFLLPLYQKWVVELREKMMKWGKM